MKTFFCETISETALRRIMQESLQYDTYMYTTNFNSAPSKKIERSFAAHFGMIIRPEGIWMRQLIGYSLVVGHSGFFGGNAVRSIGILFKYG